MLCPEREKRKRRSVDFVSKQMAVMQLTSCQTRGAWKRKDQTIEAVKDQRLNRMNRKGSSWLTIRPFYCELVEPCRA